MPPGEILMNWCSPLIPAVQEDVPVAGTTSPASAGLSSFRAQVFSDYAGSLSTTSPDREPGIKEAVYPCTLRRQPGPDAGDGNVRFDLGEWCFLVNTTDPGLVAELSEYLGAIHQSARAEVLFLGRLISATEQRRLNGWAWKKERICCT